MLLCLCFITQTEYCCTIYYSIYKKLHKIGPIKFSLQGSILCKLCKDPTLAHPVFRPLLESIKFLSCAFIYGFLSEAVVYLNDVVRQLFGLKH